MASRVRETFYAFVPAASLRLLPSHAPASLRTTSAAAATKQKQRWRLNRGLYFDGTGADAAITSLPLLPAAILISHSSSCMLSLILSQSQPLFPFSFSPR